jgi:hypothetical protein
VAFRRWHYCEFHGWLLGRWDEGCPSCDEHTREMADDLPFLRGQSQLVWLMAHVAWPLLSLARTGLFLLLALIVFFLTVRLAPSVFTFPLSSTTAGCFALGATFAMVYLTRALLPLPSKLGCVRTVTAEIILLTLIIVSGSFVGVDRLKDLGVVDTPHKAKVRKDAPKSTPRPPSTGR